jgi:hypothetical protein
MNKMNPRLQVNDSPRAGVPAGLDGIPLITIAWRALRADHLRRADERRNIEDEIRAALETLADVAEESYRLRCSIHGKTNIPNNDNYSQQILNVAGRLEQMLAKAQVIIVTSEGQPYTADMMELLDNIAQRPESDAQEMRVVEVITPAVLYRSALLRRGKAVISIPAGNDQAANAKE